MPKVEGKKERLVKRPNDRTHRFFFFFFFFFFFYSSLCQQYLSRFISLSWCRQNLPPKKCYFWSAHHSWGRNAAYLTMRLIHSHERPWKRLTAGADYWRPRMVLRKRQGGWRRQTLRRQSDQNTRQQHLGCRFLFLFCPSCLYPHYSSWNWKVEGGKFDECMMGCWVVVASMWSLWSMRSHSIWEEGLWWDWLQKLCKKSNIIFYYLHSFWV